MATIYGIYQQISEEASKLWDAIKKAYEELTSDESIGGMVQDFEQGGFEFEEKAGWEPVLGAARVLMLPTAMG